MFKTAWRLLLYVILDRRSPSRAVARAGRQVMRRLAKAIEEYQDRHARG